MTDARKAVIDGLAAAIRDPECPVQFSPLLMEARQLLVKGAPRMPGREEAVRTACAFEWPHDERGACIVTEPVLARLVDAILALSPAPPSSDGGAK